MVASTINASTWDRRRLTIGIEEEFHLVDLRSRRLTPRAGELLTALSDRPGTFVAELQQTVIETNSSVTASLEDLGKNLRNLRAELVRAARPLGVGIASAGTMPLSVPIAITETPRFRRMLADYQLLVREQLICGMQVHVGIPDRDVAARLVDRVSPWLPALVALSASSPFSHTGDDTGYASSRSLIWTRWPTSGRAGSFASAAEYDALVQNLVASGTISDPGMIYFDVRVSSHVPTLELRVCDACHLVDTVVLIAGLFRAIAVRELSRLEDNPAMLVSPTLHRAAMWRAARSGLEGELVDLSVPRSVPAGVLVRSVVQELRPELEMNGDWELVHTLTEDALAHGSAAVRQREALRRSQHITDVVDLIVSETAGDTAGLTANGSPPRLLDGYTVSHFDEALHQDGRVRSSHAHVLDALCSLSTPELARRRELLLQTKRASGVVFRSTDEEDHSEFAVDFVPRVLSGEEWSRLQGGTQQRARALDAFLQDIYGEGAIVRDGVLPGTLVARSPGNMHEARLLPAGTRRAHVVGFDIVRDGDGRWLVLEDNARVPSGVAYAMQNHRMMRHVFPDFLANQSLLDPEQVPSLLRRTLEWAAPRGASEHPSVVLLSEGPSDAAYFEHRMLSDEMGIPLAVPSQLSFDDGRLFYSSDGRKRRGVDVLYLRIDDLLSQVGQDGGLLGPCMLDALRTGKLATVNAIGNGLADDKSIYRYVPKFIEYYLGERPLLEQVPTYHCANPDERRMVLSRLNEFVIKPVDGYGGFGVLIGPHATHKELAAARALIAEQPSRWIAQEMVTLSTHPSYDRGKLRPRHVDLRVFVYYGEEAIVVPAALTRVAPSGSLIVNSSRGGGAKDTWLLS